MGTSIKRPDKSATVLRVVFFLLFLSSSCAGVLPTAADIDQLAEKARFTCDAFMQESFQLRMGYEFKGKFLTKDNRETLQKIAKRAGNDLERIKESQQELKVAIENYNGDDWDARYGETGLWRKLSADIYMTVFSKCQIDFYLALSSHEPGKNEILHRILEQINLLNLAQPPAALQQLRARIFALLTETDPTYKPLTRKKLDAIRLHSNVNCSILTRVAIERIRLFGLEESNQLEQIAGDIIQNECADDIELVLSLAFLQRQLNMGEEFEKTVRLFGQTEGILGLLILSDLTNQIDQGQLTEEKLQQVSIFEAELGTQAAWNEGPEKHKEFLENLAGQEKFQTPLIVYVAAMSLAEQSPAKAVVLLVKASQLQKNGKLKISAQRIAEQGAQLAYNCFIDNSMDCKGVINAFENYKNITGQEIDEQLEYLYATILDSCGEIRKKSEILERIASRPYGKWRNRARLDRIIEATQQGLDEKQSAQKVLEILGKNETANCPELNLYKSKALWQLGRSGESLACLFLAIDSNNCEYAGEAVELLSEIISQIDQLQEQADDFSGFVKDFKKSAEFCYKCLDDRLSGLLFAEIAILAVDKEKDELSVVDKLLKGLTGKDDDNEPRLLRCRARMNAKLGKFEEAAGLWAQICEIRKPQAVSANKRSWQWWRAKFYELYCWSKLQGTQKADVKHTIEVLENSFQDIPQLWSGKLGSLKRQCLTLPVESNK